MKKNIGAMCVAAGLALLCSPAFAEPVQPDNSAKNTRDRADAALTPGDQSNDPADVAITAEVRRAVVADSGLSVNGQNVKIITINRVVTLRGPVKNAAEREKVAAMAKTVAGVTKVDNQIEITGE